MSVAAILRTVREMLPTPHQWLQRAWRAHRNARGDFAHGPVNCRCLGAAITDAVAAATNGDRAFTELRSDVELELLRTLDADGHKYAACYQFNDARTTSHTDVLALLDKTLTRLEQAA